MPLNRMRTVFSALLLIAVVSSSARSSVFYVDRAAAGENNGSSWANAFTGLQMAVDAAGDAGGGEVWARSGVYHTIAPPGATDSFVALHPNAVDIIGEEADIHYVDSNGAPGSSHLTLLYVDGVLDKPISGVQYAGTDGSPFAERLSGILSSEREVLVFANHPSHVVTITARDLLEAANARSLHGMEIRGEQDVAKWDYVLANLDDQAGDCSKVLWAVHSGDQHYIEDMDYRRSLYMTGCIPTAAQDPIYAERRLAFRDMIRRGSHVCVAVNCKLGVPSYEMESSGGSSSRMTVRIHVYNTNGAASASIRFYGCDRNTGSIPGTLLMTAPLILNADNAVSFHMTHNGAANGESLTPQQKANIKYIRPVVVWSDGRRAFLQPVRIRNNGEWWNGPAHELAGSHADIGPSPYPAGGSDTGETVYFNPHSHTTESDGHSSPAEMRAKAWEAFGGLDPTKPRFTVITDHNRRTPFTIPVSSVVEMRRGVALYGGFSGWEAGRDQRDPLANPTVIDGQGIGRCITADGSGWQEGLTVIDGFTLRNGNARYHYGGGLYASSCRPIITNCIFSSNTALCGGGICSASQTLTTIENCVFAGNSAPAQKGGAAFFINAYVWMSGCRIEGNSAAFGAGVSAQASVLTADTTTIQDNVSGGSGGGLRSERSDVTLGRCRLIGNTAAKGAGIYLQRSRPLITSCVFTDNLATGVAGLGGAVYSAGDETDAVYAYNTLVGNSASTGGGMYLEGSCALVANNILAFNQGGISSSGGIPVLSHNNAYSNGVNYSGIGPGAGDISADPQFVDRDQHDYHLAAGSPCIDAGSSSVPQIPDRDMDGQYRTWGSGPDIGADEYWPLTCNPRLLADGEQLSWPSAGVTAVFDGAFYVESDDRAYGIRVEKQDHNLQAGWRASVTGLMRTNADGERYLEAADAVHCGSGGPGPLFVANRNVGGCNWEYDADLKVGQIGTGNSQDLNNIGLLVRTTGLVTYSGTEFFYIDDGSRLEDGSGHTGIRVMTHGLAVPAKGRYVCVTGASSCRKQGGSIQRLIRATAITCY